MLLVLNRSGSFLMQLQHKLVAPNLSDGKQLSVGFQWSSGKWIQTSSSTRASELHAESSKWTWLLSPYLSHSYIRLSRAFCPVYLYPAPSHLQRIHLAPTNPFNLLLLTRASSYLPLVLSILSSPLIIPFFLSVSLSLSLPTPLSLSLFL